MCTTTIDILYRTSSVRVRFFPGNRRKSPPHRLFRNELYAHKQQTYRDPVPFCRNTVVGLHGIFRTFCNGWREFFTRSIIKTKCKCQIRPLCVGKRCKPVGKPFCNYRHMIFLVIRLWIVKDFVVPKNFSFSSTDSRKLNFLKIHKPVLFAGVISRNIQNIWERNNFNVNNIVIWLEEDWGAINEEKQNVVFNNTFSIV